ncbi:MAG: hypothetical protein PHU33_18165, partial [Bacteroidales bacterium]|nr:hypothetical protein [Bacteroidales bacterium]
ISKSLVGLQHMVHSDQHSMSYGNRRSFSASSGRNFAILGILKRAMISNSSKSAFNQDRFEENVSFSQSTGHPFACAFVAARYQARP